MDREARVVVLMREQICPALGMAEKTGREGLVTPCDRIPQDRAQYCHAFGAAIIYFFACVRADPWLLKCLRE